LADEVTDVALAQGVGKGIQAADGALGVVRHHTWAALAQLVDGIVQDFSDAFDVGSGGLLLLREKGLRLLLYLTGSA
jgi:hypothetical protein